MKKLRVGLGLLLAVAACADAEGGTREPSGVYALIQDDGCLRTLSFRPHEAVFAVSLQCEFAGGGFGAEVTSGTYAVEGDRLVLTADETTCSKRELGTQRVKFVLHADGDLMLVTAATLDQYVSIPERQVGTAGAQGGTLQLGCWDGEYFEPN